MVLVPRGTYRLDSPVFMHWSNVVLRGAGRDATVLHFTRPLDDSYRPTRQASGNSRWSWTGGQIWFIAPERRARSEAEDFAGSEGWLLGDTLATVAPAPVASAPCWSPTPASSAPVTWSCSSARTRRTRAC